MQGMDWLFDIAGTTVAISAFSAVVAVSAAAVTFWFARKNLSRELINQNLNVVATRIKYFEEFRKWADRLTEVLTEAIHLCDLDPAQVKGEPFFDRRHRLLITLSAMIDKGRWFFPNIEVDDYGSEKELGYRGYAKRHFVGRVQKIIDPEGERAEFERIHSAVQSNIASMRRP
jgi:hypothetical protein